MARFIQICMSLEKEQYLTIPCDQFEIDEENNVNVYYDGELWGYFTGVEYALIIDDEVYDQFASEDGDEDDDDDDDDEDENDDDDEPESPLPGTVDMVVSAEALADVALSNGGVEVDAESR